MDAIVAPFRERTQDEWVNTHLTMLVGAIYWFVSESAALAPGEKMGESSEARYKSARKDILSALRDAREAVHMPTPVTRGRKTKVSRELEATFWEGWQDSINTADFDQTIGQVTQRGWLKSDWYRSVDLLRNAADGEQDADDSGEDLASAAAHVQTARPDLMLQDTFDYLSERNRADYRIWEADILCRVRLLETDRGSDDMQLDA